MTKLETLKQMVAQMFENAEEKEQIEQLAKVNNAIDEVGKENAELAEKNGELIKSYRELIKHTSFKEEPKQVETQATNEAPSLEAYLTNFLASHQEEK